PIWPATKIWRPCAATPLAKPLAGAQPLGWRSCAVSPRRLLRTFMSDYAPLRASSRPQLESLDLARLGLGQGVGELDRARVLVGGDGGLDVVLERLHARLVGGEALAQHHVRLDDVAALGV